MISFKMFSNTFTYLFSSTRRLSPKPSIIAVLLIPANSLKVTCISIAVNSTLAHRGRPSNVFQEGRAQSALTNLSFVKDDTILKGFLLLVIGAFFDIIMCPGLGARVNATT